MLSSTPLPVVIKYMCYKLNIPTLLKHTPYFCMIHGRPVFMHKFLVILPFIVVINPYSLFKFKIFVLNTSIYIYILLLLLLLLAQVTYNQIHPSRINYLAS